MARRRLHCRPNHYHFAVVSILLVSGCGLAAPIARGAEDPPVDFARDIQPILAQKCLACHGPDDQESGLRLDRRDLATAPADSGTAAIVPGDPPASQLLARVTSANEDERMPPDGDSLRASEVAQLRDWIADGARYDTHWAYRPLAGEPRPEVKNTGWTHNAIDFFVLARLEAADIAPSPAADRYTLIKRLYYDLHGVPPTIAAADAFVADKRPDAYERLVDRLLASPRFAERWARHWLDKARYADSDGYEKDNHRPDAWRYRDWVIQAIQDDMPFDQFTVEQLAGDMFPQRTENQLLATAFNRQTLTNTEGGTDREQWRVAAVMDRIETAGSVWLGLTVGCARCHNHKYDQLTQREYYELFAYFDNGDEANAEIPISRWHMIRFAADTSRHQEKVAALRTQLERVRSEVLPRMTSWEKKALQQLDETAGNTPEPQQEGDDAQPAVDRDDGFPQPVRTALRTTPSERTTEQEAALQEAFLATQAAYVLVRGEMDKLIAAAPKPPRMSVRVLSERQQDRRATHILRRGEFKEKLEPVATGAPAALVTSATDPASRLDFARWLVDGSNALVPRVTVNHIWDHLFGYGLVRTLNDFGVRGERPSHPELLDWLAGKYIEYGWSRKQIIREIVSSATYRQSSRHRPELSAVDPTNQLLHRQNRFRLEAEAVRDSCLSVAGLLSDKVGGPSVFPPIPSGVTDLNYNSSFKWNTSQGEDRYRRGMYTYFKRTAPHPNLTTLDCPDSNVTCVKRDRSNTPLAALITLNNAVFHEAAQALAARVASRSADSDWDRLEHILRCCVARTAEEHEIATLQELLQTSRTWYADRAAEADLLVGSHGVEGVPNVETAAWVATVRVALNLDEFITRE